MNRHSVLRRPDHAKTRCINTAMKNLNDRNFRIATKQFADHGVAESSSVDSVISCKITFVFHSGFQKLVKYFFQKNDAQPRATRCNDAQPRATRCNYRWPRNSPPKTGCNMSPASGSNAAVENYENENINTCFS